MGITSLDNLLTGLDAWYERKKSRLDDDSEVLLPRERSIALRQQVAARDVPAPLLSFVRDELKEAIATWLSDPDAANVMVVLSRPVEPIAPVIEATLSGGNGLFDSYHTLLPCQHRPTDPSAIPLMLTSALDEALPPVADDGEVVIQSLPNLDQCFLRCIDGWSGIERLREVMLEHRNRFWLVGCNSWAWRFLDHVSQISSYFPEARTLPALNGAELREWLAPVANDLGLNQTDASPPDHHESSGEGANDTEPDQWIQLFELSCGSYRIASELWLGGLRLDPDDEGGKVRQSRPALPDLPSLKDEDRYLLHSLLIHGTMRRSHLAFGLGLPSHRLEPRIHRLLAEGVLQDSAGELSVMPAHYPCLVKELVNSNHFTGES
ncbi:hypothetical protein FQK07_06160 [Synechococcus sp. BSF8S]|uniref:hypothetical protein n=1 Tax=Synechococcales TaxID=1890424 RepID=UPI00162A129F|nr:MULTISPECIES: hypothetical protein [unclassified Synechococcus]MBC1260861.1 hypothetical protein [Synechococcus sp. BSF8S]MBC1263537.1 hypothetical protein [Synechococcus sp. BSA11S]